MALEALHERARHGRAAADPAAQRAEVAAVLIDVREQRREHGGHAGQQRRALALHEARQRLALQEAGRAAAARRR